MCVEKIHYSCHEGTIGSGQHWSISLSGPWKLVKPTQPQTIPKGTVIIVIFGGMIRGYDSDKSNLTHLHKCAPLRKEWLKYVCVSIYIYIHVHCLMHFWLNQNDSTWNVIQPELSFFLGEMFQILIQTISYRSWRGRVMLIPWPVLQYIFQPPVNGKITIRKIYIYIAGWWFERHPSEKD